MCIVILQKPKHKIKKKVLKNCWINNPDGAGILWTDNGKLKAFKELDDFKTLYRKYLKVTLEHGKTSNIVIHFRIATHGDIDIKNCHPHFVSKDLAFSHNGIIAIETEGTNSDTIAFRDLLKKLPKDFLTNSAICELIDGFTFSKFVFLDSDNRATILGEIEGIWKKGSWFSNTSYKKVKEVGKPLEYAKGTKLDIADYSSVNKTPYDNSYYMGEFGNLTDDELLERMELLDKVEMQGLESLSTDELSDYLDGLSKEERAELDTISIKDYFINKKANWELWENNDVHTS